MFSFEKIATWFLIFMIYSFAGWIMEVVMSLIYKHKFINRGFLVGPIVPIWGTGALFISFVLSGTENLFVIFCVSMVGGALIEYLASWIMEQLFRVRWWDYTEKQFNVNGRVCLESIISFGLGGIMIIKFTNPPLLHLFESMPLWLLYTISGALLAWMIFDIALSLWLIVGVRVTVGAVQKDATEEISSHVRKILMDKGKLNRRLVKAFPNQAPSKKPIRTRRKTSKTSSNSKTPTK